MLESKEQGAAEAPESEKPADSVLNPPPDDGRLVARAFTVDGEVDIRRYWKAGVPLDKQMPLAEEALGYLAKGFAPKHHDNMWAIWMAIQQVKSVPKRLVPLTRNEIIELGVTKKMLRELENFGLVTVKIVGLLRAGTTKSTGGTVVVYFTPQGRAYVREKLEKENTHGKVQSEDSSDAGVRQHPPAGVGGSSEGSPVASSSGSSGVPAGEQ